MQKYRVEVLATMRTANDKWHWGVYVFDSIEALNEKAAIEKAATALKAKMLDDFVEVNIKPEDARTTTLTN